MGIIDSIRGKKTLIKKSIYLQDDGRPRTIISTSKTQTKGITPTERTEQSLNKFWNYYENEGTIFAAINTTAWNTMMVGFNLTSDNADAKKLIQMYLDNLDIDLVLLENVIFALVYGDAFIEVVKNSKEEITSLKTVNPTTMIINTDQYGLITGYQQKVQGQLQSAILKPEDIIHLKFFTKPTSPYGISLIQPSKTTLDRKMKTDESLANAIERHGTSKYLVKVGTTEEFPPDAIFTDIKNELEDITTINEIIIPGLVDISTIDEKGIPGVETYSDMFQSQLIIGLLCPEEALGLGKGSTEATATVKQMMYERMIRAFQYRISNLLRLEVLNKILEKNGFEPNLVKIRFNSITDADEAVKAKWLGDLLRGYDARRGEAKPFTDDEVRAMFGYGPKEKTQEPNQGISPQEQKPVGDQPNVQDERDEDEERREEPTPSNSPV